MPLIEDFAFLAPRKSDAYKNQFGRVLFIGGSVGMSGAAMMSGMSALRAGAGLVEIAVPKSVWPIVAAGHPESMVFPVAEEDGKLSSKAVFDLVEKVEKADVIAFGPGVGISKGVRDVLQWLIGQKGLNIVIDADGLNCLSKIKDWPLVNLSNLILTPHVGELKRLWKGLFREPLPEDRLEQANMLSIKTNAVIVLKGENTIVSNGVDHYVNHTGNAGMATAGSGDVLTGITAGFWAQILKEQHCTNNCGDKDCDCRLRVASLAVKVHGTAGDIAADEKGQISMVATDLIKSLPAAVQKYV